MELIVNSNPLWTKEHLDHMRKYSDSYGVVISPTDYENELNNIRNRNAGLRCRLCYEIFENEKYVGDIVIRKNELHRDNEIDILIFDNFQRQGYAKKAIREFINNYYDCRVPLRAVIRKENKCKKRIQGVLEKTGFKLEPKFLDGNEVWTYWRD